MKERKGKCKRNDGPLTAVKKRSHRTPSRVISVT